MLGGLQIIEVEAGTEIEQGGETLTVTDEQAVRKGGSIYMTAKQIALLKAHVAKDAQ